MAVLITPENKCVAEGRGEKWVKREKRERVKKKGNIMAKALSFIPIKGRNVWSTSGQNEAL